jgi:type II secretory pathway component GspD/PulD (secretin)
MKLPHAILSGTFTSLFLLLHLNFFAEEGQVDAHAESSTHGALFESSESPLLTRTFTLDSETLRALNTTALPTQTANEVIKAYFGGIGVDFNTSEQRSLFFNDRTGMLIVRATFAELEKIEHALECSEVSPKQLVIEMRIAEISQSDKKALGFDWYLGNVLLDGQSVNQNTNVANSLEGSGIVPGVLTDPQFRLVLRALEQRQDVDLMSAPRVTTLSGREARMQIENARPPITIPPFTAPGKMPKAVWSPSSVSPPTD